jgi:hypothetical protein
VGGKEKKHFFINLFLFVLLIQIKQNIEKKEEEEEEEDDN